MPLYRVKKGQTHSMQVPLKSGGRAGRKLRTFRGGEKIELPEHKAKYIMDKLEPVESSVVAEKPGSAEEEEEEEKESPDSRFKLQENADGNWSVIDTENEGIAMNDQPLSEEEAQKLLEELNNG